MTAARKKLTEAELLLSQLASASHGALGGELRFDSAWGAFLSATRSVLKALEHTKTLLAALDADDRALVDWMKKTRDKNHYQARQGYRKTVEEIPISHSYEDESGRVEVFAPPDAWPAAIIRKPRRLVAVEGRDEEIISVCKRYLEVLARLVRDAEQREGPG